MGYYKPMGDYRTYGYAGDPGFLSGLWRGIKTVGKVLLGVQPKVRATPPALPPPPRPPAIPAPPGRMPPMPSGRGGGFFPGVGLGMGMSVSRKSPPVAVDQTGCCPSGYHPAKDGSGRCVRNRRMNVANPKALRRAIRRTDGFVKLAQRALKGTGYVVRRR